MSLRTIVSLLILASALHAQIPSSCTPTCVPAYSAKVVYVDSAAGSDSNPGNCPPNLVLTSVMGTPSWSTCAYAGLAKVQATLVAGQFTGFTRGSTWREAGIAPSAAVNRDLVFAAVGPATAAKPVFDLSLAISSGAWTPDGSGCYSTSITLPSSGPGTGESYLNLFETVSGATTTLNAYAMAATSSTSMTVATGPATFTIPATFAGIASNGAPGWGFIVGTVMKVSRAADGTVFMQGSVTALTATTVTINVTSTGGAGTFSDWKLFPPTPAVCDANAGIFYADTVMGNTGTQTVYVHPIGSTNPATDGNTYEYSANFVAIDTSIFGVLVNEPRPQLYNLSAKKNLRNDGSFLLGRGAYADGLQADFGGKHNMLVQGDATVKNTSMKACNYSLGGIPFIHFDDAATTGLNTLTNAVFDGAGSASAGTCNVYYSHGAGFGTVTLTNWYGSTNVGPMFNAQFPINIVNSTCGPGTSGCVSGIESMNITGLTSAATTSDFNLSGSGKVYNISNSNFSGTGSFLTGGATASITGTTFKGAGHIVMQSILTFFASGNTYYAKPIFNTDSTVTITGSDNNIYCYVGDPATYQGSTRTVAAWQGLGFDRNSTFGATCP